MTQPSKIEDSLQSVFNRGGGSKNAANRENIESQIAEKKSSVRVATTANVSSLSGLLTIDNVVLSSGDRILVKDQTTASQNGIYISDSGDWYRANDANSDSKVKSGLIVFVREGELNADSGWFLSTDESVNLGVTSLIFRRFTNEIDTELLEGLGIDLSYDSANNTLTISSDIGSQVSTQIIQGSGLDLNYDSEGDTLTFSVSIDNKTPSSSSATGTPGEICYDSSYLYICVSQNSWRRIPHSSW